jgi:hypothetical protein
MLFQRHCEFALPATMRRPHLLRFSEGFSVPHIVLFPSVAIFGTVLVILIFIIIIVAVAISIRKAFKEAFIPVLVFGISVRKVLEETLVPVLVFLVSMHQIEHDVFIPCFDSLQDVRFAPRSQCRTAVVLPSFVPWRLRELDPVFDGLLHLNLPKPFTRATEFCFVRPMQLRQEDEMLKAMLLRRPHLK